MKNNLENFLISSEELYKKIQDENIMIIDSRWSLDPNKSFYKKFQKDHIPNSIFLDLNMFFNKKTSTPHMLPSEENFKKIVSEMGIKNSHKIVIYDEKGFFNSSRVWFMFKLFGHNNVVILNGGYNNWLQKGFQTENKIKKYENSNYKTSYKSKLVITKKELVYLLKERENFVLVDARSQRRFRGLEPEPRLGIKKGNIHSSINIPFSEIYDENGLLSKPKILKKKLFFDGKLNNIKVVALCGSGITACNILFALNSLSHSNNILYDGSWAEWGKKD